MDPQFFEEAVLDLIDASCLSTPRGFTDLDVAILIQEHYAVPSCFEGTLIQSLKRLVDKDRLSWKNGRFYCSKSEGRVKRPRVASYSDSVALHLFDLPVEILSMICDYIEITDIISLSKSCKSLHQLSKQTMQWRRLALHLKSPTTVPATRWKALGNDNIPTVTPSSKFTVRISWTGSYDVRLLLQDSRLQILRSLSLCSLQLDPASVRYIACFRSLDNIEFCHTTGSFNLDVLTTIDSLRSIRVEYSECAFCSDLQLSPTMKSLVVRHSHIELLSPTHQAGQTGGTLQKANHMSCFIFYNNFSRNGGKDEDMVCVPRSLVKHIALSTKLMVLGVGMGTLRAIVKLPHNLTSLCQLLLDGHPSFPLLEHLAKRVSTSLTCLQFRGFRFLEALHSSISLFASTLKYLCVSGWEDLESIFPRKQAVRFPELIELDVSWCGEMGKSLLRRVRSACPCLTRIYIGRKDQIPGRILLKLQEDPVLSITIGTMPFPC